MINELLSLLLAVAFAALVGYGIWLIVKRFVADATIRMIIMIIIIVAIVFIVNRYMGFF